MLFDFRKLTNKEDYARIREFLRMVFLLNDRKEYSWQTARFDYWRSHILPNCRSGERFEDCVYICENGAGEIIAVVNTEDPGCVFFQVHPGYKSETLEQTMITLGEEAFLCTETNHNGKIAVFSRVNDSLRNRLLEINGYERSKWEERAYSRSLEDFSAKTPTLDGIILRSMNGAADLSSRSWASWRAFHADEPDDAYERDGGVWYLNVMNTPLYRSDLDIVAENRQGQMIGFCTVWFDAETGTGYFEPVGIIPEYQKKGLGKALLYEGLNRLKGAGGTLATVAGQWEGAYRLYTSVMGDASHVFRSWIKSRPTT